MSSHPSVSHVLQFFEFDHLPPELQAISEPLCKLAHEYAKGLDGPELTVGLRKLLEAKDCLVRAALAGPTSEELHGLRW